MRYSKGLPAEAFWATGDPFAYPIVLLPAEQDFIQERFSCERVCGPPGVHPFADYREGFSCERVCGPPSVHPFADYREGFSCERVCGPPGVHPFAGYRDGLGTAPPCCNKPSVASAPNNTLGTMSVHWNLGENGAPPGEFDDFEDPGVGSVKQSCGPSEVTCEGVCACVSVFHMSCCGMHTCLPVSAVFLILVYMACSSGRGSAVHIF